MKAILYILLIFLSQLFTAQTATKQQLSSDLPELEITEGISLHIISPEPIQYVDLSTQQLTGDLPSTQIARVKIVDKPESTDKEKNQNLFLHFNGDQIGVITVVGQSFIAQYKAVYRNSENLNTITNTIFSRKKCSP